MMLLNPARHAKNALRRYMQRHNPMSYLRPRYRFSDSRAGDYGILSVAPPIFYVPYWVNGQLVLHPSLTPLFDSLANTRAYFLNCWFWCIEEPPRVDIVKRFETEWNEVFFNKLVRRQLYAETLNRIKNA